MSESSETLARFIVRLRVTADGHETPPSQTLRKLMAAHRAVLIKSCLLLPVDPEDDALIDKLMQRRLARGVSQAIKRA